MCGIAGVFDARGGIDPAAVERQVRTMDHRGPDCWGLYAAQHCVIGQTRLSVIDLVSGDPPICNERGDIGSVLNGEIYNYQALRDDLERGGHRLRTSGDTEVLAHLAEKCQPAELCAQLDGMFAFAVADDRHSRLIIGRDRLGKKPLYYWSSAGRVVFGSEIKAVIANPFVSADLNRNAISAYMTFGYVPTPWTFFDGIMSLPPGHAITVEGDGSMRIEEYWRPRVPGPDGPPVLDVSDAEAAVEVRRLLDAAVRRRLIADVPLGAFLSGGIDSSSVVALMAAASPRPVRTFTIGFEDSSGFDERRYAELVADRFGTEHHEFVVSPSAIDLVERLVWHHDQPFGDSSAIPTFLLSELTRAHVTVALCGDGGDELFAGYERFAAGVAAATLEHFPRPLKTLAGLAAAATPSNGTGRLGKAARFFEHARLGMPDAFLSWISYVPDEMVERLIPGGWRGGQAQYAELWRASEGAATLDRLLLLNARTYLLDDLLPKIDRMSMAHGLEVRSPFLDRELVEFAFRLPPRTKARGLRLKRCLKAAVRDLVPTEILQRPKHGFGVPLDRWFRTDLAGYTRSMLGSGARVRKHLDGNGLDETLGRHLNGSVNRGHALWTLLTLEVFLRQQGW